MSKLIGREAEIEILEAAMSNNKSELIAVYGRRRVGKTFLIRDYFKKDLVFEVAGLFNGNMTDQLRNFSKELKKRNKKKKTTVPLNWIDAFRDLEKYLNGFKSKRKKIILLMNFRG